jgi:AcrR family transcriptional regulator
LTRKPRTDARDNRAGIVAAAHAVFAATAPDAPVREIATHAGVAPATVYRHFPTRAALLDAVLSDRVASCEADLRSATSDPDPWRALSATIRHFAARQIADRALNEALFAAPGAAYADARRTHAAALAMLVDRARSSGAVRPDLTVHDVRSALLAIASLRTLPPPAANTTITRVTNLLLSGMRTPKNALPAALDVSYRHS